MEYVGIFVRLCLDDCKNRLNRLSFYFAVFSFFFFFLKAQDVSLV